MTSQSTGAITRMRSVYMYAFYKLYMWSRAVNSTDEYHELNATIMLSLVQITNLGAILGLLQLLTGLEALALLSLNKLIAVLVALTLLIVNYFLLKTIIGYRAAIQHFEGESLQQNRLGGRLVALYVIGSPVLLVAIYIGVAMQQG